MNKNIRKTVYKILKEDSYSREDDNYLILRVLEELMEINTGEAFSVVLSGMKYKGISFEAITRSRRKFFEEYPELKIEPTERARRKEEENYILEYSNHILRID